MIVFPNAKINLGLNVVNKRADGFHDIETVFYPVPLTDCLEIVESSAMEFSSSGIPVDCSNDDNLCVKAYRLLQQYCPVLGNAKIHLHKTIPFGAGLGGGSADAAFLLTAVNEYQQLGLSSIQLEDLASELGSDVPFFVNNEPVFAQGTGNEFSPIDLSLKGTYIVLVKPEYGVNTAKAYAGITPNKPKVSVVDVLKQPHKTWKSSLENDFESSVFPHYPQLAQIKDELYKQGAFYAAMSGSGSTIFGLFENLPPECLLHSFPNCQVFQHVLS